MQSQLLSKIILVFALLLQAACVLSLPSQVSPRDDTTVIFGQYGDTRCSQNKVDQSGGMSYPAQYGKCSELLGKSMQLFWLKKGCVSECAFDQLLKL